MAHRGLGGRRENKRWTGRPRKEATFKDFRTGSRGHLTTNFSARWRRHSRSSSESSDWDTPNTQRQREDGFDVLRFSNNSRERSLSPEPVQLTAEQLRRGSPNCKLITPSSLSHITSDLISCTDPVPVYSVPKTKPVTPNKELDISVINQCLKDVEQNFLDYASKKSKSDCYPSIEDDYLPVSKLTSVANYVIIARDGLVPSTVLKQSEDPNKGYKRLLYSAPEGEEELKKIREKFSSFQGSRQFSPAERAHVPEGSFEMFFKDGEQGRAFCDANSSAKPLPHKLDTIGQANKEIVIFFHWSPFPLQNHHVVFVKSKDYLKAIRIFQKNDLIHRVRNCRNIDELFNQNPEAAQSLEVQFSRRSNFDVESGSSDMFRTEEDVRHAVRTLLEINGVELLDMKFYHNCLPLIEDDKIVFKINHRIGRCVVNSHNWTNVTNTPYTEEEWKKYFEENEIPWKVTLNDYNPKDKSKQRSGVIEFTDFEFGIKIARYIRENMTRDFCFFHPRQKEGVQFTSRVSWKFFVPPEVRRILHKEFITHDLEWRTAQNPDRKWSRMRDLPGDIVAVEGWDADFVDKKVAEFKNFFVGESFDCSSLERSQLLYGCGLSYLNKMHKSFAETIFLSVNRLNQKIVMIGKSESIAALKQILIDYVKNIHNYVVDCSIVIESPRFLPIMTVVLDFNGEKKIREFLGGDCFIDFKAPNRLIFKGSVHQYNQLNILLDNTQYNIFDKFVELGFGPRAKEIFVSASCCPVCLTPYVDKFRLSCSHTYCFSCLLHLINSGIRSGTLPIRCHKVHCGKNIAIRDILTLLFDERSINYKEFFSSHLTPIFRATIRMAAKEDNLLHCIKPGCEGLFEPPFEPPTLQDPLNPQLVPSSPPIAISCQICRTVRCSKCANPPHEGVTCEREAQLRANDSMSLESYLKGAENKVKRCPSPKCNALIEKNDGCHHMLCANCNIHFCWLCLKMANTQGEIYKHLQEIHGGTGGGFEFLDLDFDMNNRHFFAQLREHLDLFPEQELIAPRLPHMDPGFQRRRPSPPPGLFRGNGLGFRGAGPPGFLRAAARQRALSPPAGNVARQPEIERQRAVSPPPGFEQPRGFRQPAALFFDSDDENNEWRW